MIKIYLDNTESQQQEFNIPVKVKNFSDIGSFQFIVEYDPTDLEFHSLWGTEAVSTEPDYGTLVAGTHGFHGNALNGEGKLINGEGQRINNPQRMRVTISAFKTSINSINLPDDTILYTIRFIRKNNNSSILYFPSDAHAPNMVFGGDAKVRQSEFIGCEIPALVQLLNINSSPAPELQQIHGIGPILEGRIIAERSQPYTSINDCRKRTRGIGAVVEGEMINANVQI